MDVFCRYPLSADETDLDTVVDRLEEAWTAPVSDDGSWPVEVAARVCPVFRYLTGGQG